jgi:hypothetical protein
MADNKLSPNEMAYLSRGKYALFFVEVPSLTLTNFATNWEAHKKPSRLRTSSEHTVNLEWGNLTASLSFLLFLFSLKHSVTEFPGERLQGHIGESEDSLDLLREDLGACQHGLRHFHRCSGLVC